MPKFKLLITFVIIIIAGFISAKEVSAQGYLFRADAVGGFLDTMGSASTNDTGAVFRNNVDYTRIDVEYLQNSTTGSAKLNLSGLYEVRGRYRASDSTMVIERKSIFGWVTVPVILSGATTPVNSIPFTLRTGSVVFTFAGRKE